MAEIIGHRNENIAIDIFHFMLVLNVFKSGCLLVAGIESQSQAFIQTDNHLTYIVGDASGIHLEVKPEQTIQEITFHDGTISSAAIRFHPPLLDFQEQPVGMPRMEQVTLQNLDTKNSLYLLSISGSTVHFHCSFFQDKRVPPGSNTTFDVVFLARHVGNVENTLYIHTSQGSFKYQVFGVGTPNPYRLRPYLGARVPLNSSFSPLIQMHNPHSSALQLLEMYASMGDLHLELPTGEAEAPSALWEIGPYETKQVMKASFVGRVENNHTAFIRIKTNQENHNQLLVLPMEVEVSSAPGIYSFDELLDFGIVRTLDGPQSIKLRLINSGNKPLHITSVGVSPPNDAISIDFRPVKLQPDLKRYSTVAHIMFLALKAIHPKQWSGKIIVKSKNSIHKLVIPYQANVMHGSLVYNVNSTYFFSHAVLLNTTRPLNLTNTFNFSLVIYNVTLPPDVKHLFSVLNFTSPMILRPQQTVAPFMLLFHPNTTQIHFATTLTIHTNASGFKIPIIVYSGMLKVIHHRPEKYKGQLDFGTLGVGENRTMIFTIANDNPVRVFISEYGTEMKNVKIRLLGIEKGNSTTLTKQHNVTEIDKNPLILDPFHFAVFSVYLVAPIYEGSFTADLLIVSQFQDLFIPITLKTAEGSLNAIPEKIVFDKAYPGKVPFKVLKIQSSFVDNMEVQQVTFQPADNRFYYQPPSSAPVILEAEKETVIGRIYFDAQHECEQDCYVGLPTYTPEGHQWMLGVSLDREVADIDQYLYTRFQQRWQKVTQTQLNTANVTIELDTNQVRGFLFSAQAHLHWPSLIRKCKIKFPLTQIGNISMSDFLLENTGDVSVMVQILPLTLYPSPQTVLDMLSSKLASELSEYVEMDDSDIFTLLDLEHNNASPQNAFMEYRKQLENSLGLKPHKHSLSAILPARARIRVKLGFQPKDDLSRTSLIIIRNNLTIIDTVVIQGQGGRGEMRFGNRKPGSQSPLLFEMTEKHLKNCDRKKSAKLMMPHFTVKRTFTIRNTGKLSFYIHGFSINDANCEGYGFKVLDCQGFELQSNTSRKIDIAFTPDFTMSRIRRSLSIYTSLGPPANYTLQATVPPHTLSKCSSALPRPTWEPILYYSIVCVMGFLLFCIIVASYFEADRLFVADILKHKLKLSAANMQTFDKNKVLDFKLIPVLSPIGTLSSTTTATITTANTTTVSPVTKVSSTSEAKPTTVASSRPVLHLANGHIEHKEQRRSSFGRTFMAAIKSIILIWGALFTSRKAISSSSPSARHHNTIGTNASLLLDAGRPPDLVVSNSLKSHSLLENSTTNQHLPNSIEETLKPEMSTTQNLQSSLPNLTIRGRKVKSSRRHQNDVGNYSPEVIQVPGDANNKASPDTHKEYSGKYPNKDKDTNHRMDHDIKESNKSSRSVNHNNNKKVTSFDPDTLTPLWDTKEQVYHGRKHEAKNKHKPQVKSQEKDLTKERLPRNLTPHFDDKDETSSTTTESSNADIEEKPNIVRDSTPDLAKPKKSKVTPPKPLPDSSLSVAMESSVGLDDDFVISTRSKSHKRMKNMLKDSSLELDYNPDRSKRRDKRDLTSLINVTDLIDNIPKKLVQSAKAKNKVGLSASYLQERVTGTDSPPPVWAADFLKPSLAPGDLAELSIQTANFADKHKPVLSPQNTGIAPINFSSDPLSSSSRSSSYSSIVSSCSGGTTGANVIAGSGLTGENGMATKQRLTKSLSDPKKTSTSSNMGLFQTFGPDPSHPGIIGTKTVTKPVSPVLATLRTPWTMSPGALTNNDSFFSLQTIPETQRNMTGVDDANLDSNFPGTTAENGYNFAGSFQQSHNLIAPTMMQELQADRRRRLQVYQMSQLREGWPGFDIPPVRSDSLWDPEYHPTEPAWSPLTDSPPTSAMNTLWSTLTNSANSGWSSLSSSLTSIWNTSPSVLEQGPPPIALPGETVPTTSIAQSGMGIPITTSTQMGMPLSTPVVDTSPQQTGVPQFDPFSTLGDIWNTGQAASNTGAGARSSPTTAWDFLQQKPPSPNDM